jgi:2-phospho-L-lactate guanylyltransferase
MEPVPGHARRTGVVIPIRAFRSGKARLADALDADQRAELARAMAERVVAAADPLPAVVVTSDGEVRAWAEAIGIEVVPDPARGLDAAAHAGTDRQRDFGHERIVVIHADLPRARAGSLLRFATPAPGIVSLVPCHRDDGTPVLSVPASVPFPFAYGPGSARRHAAIARGLGLAVHVVRDPELGYDVDVPADLVTLDPLTVP